MGYYALKTPNGLMIIRSLFISINMDGWMDGATGGVTRQVQYFFDDTQGISPLENLARGGRLRIFPVIHPSNHPKENVRQLSREWADIWCAYRYAEL
jgi:hypothetical protein